MSVKDPDEEDDLMPAKTTNTRVDVEAGADDAYVLPITHVKVPRALVNIGFWGGLAAAAVVGAVELPVAVAIGAGVLVARHATGRSGDGATG
ncbi:MAG: hypothetical protein ACXWBN_00405 [Acidimicrobiales bacterium]